MPYTIRKVAKGYRVSTPNAVHAKHTTKEKAEAQVNLMRAVEHGWKPTGGPMRNRSKGASGKAVSAYKKDK